MPGIDSDAAINPFCPTNSAIQAYLVVDSLAKAGTTLKLEPAFREATLLLDAFKEGMLPLFTK